MRVRRGHGQQRVRCCSPGAATTAQLRLPQVWLFALNRHEFTASTLPQACSSCWMCSLQVWSTPAPRPDLRPAPLATGWGQRVQRDQPANAPPGQPCLAVSEHLPLMPPMTIRLGCRGWHLQRAQSPPPVQACHQRVWWACSNGRHGKLAHSAQSASNTGGKRGGLSLSRGRVLGCMPQPGEWRELKAPPPLLSHGTRAAEQKTASCRRAIEYMFEDVLIAAANQHDLKHGGALAVGW